MDHGNLYPVKSVLAQQYELRTAVTIGTSGTVVSAQAPTAAQSLLTVAAATNTITCTFDKCVNKPVYADAKAVQAAGTWDGKLDVVARTTTSVTFQCRKSSDGTALTLPDGDYLISVIIDNSAAVS